MPLMHQDHQAVCHNGHSFDYASSGYLNLFLSQKKAHGDNKEMIQARSAFLNSGAYGFLRDALVKEVQQYHPHTFLDLACGEGYYTQKIPVKEKYGIDLSKDALKHAAKQDASTQYLLSSIFDLPFADQCADMILTCFAPFAREEVERLLVPGGHFVFVTPGPDHLIEMKQVLYDHPYRNIIKPLDTSLALIDQKMISDTFCVSADLMQALFAMTPYAYRTGARGKEKLVQAGSFPLTAQFVIRIYQKQPEEQL
jgi:23S rRNA (guanine745-N1)-methyltransferase